MPLPIHCGIPSLLPPALVAQALLPAVSTLVSTPSLLPQAAQRAAHEVSGHPCFPTLLPQALAQSVRTKRAAYPINPNGILP